ncbi:hypothetical protein [Bradyrhizobium roseum]|uniref:hypothetical protein n=1 Tax=Bradyrhizobium roseum TaxID=3056648 RepID=UPI0026264E19|nr:hypothetical protein [Bradyrhizobium roseus]WKA31848.1 hypothetical protein QUH67_17540 [Bradyrhizobium roseus]
MAKKPDHLADLETDDTAGVLGKLLADEDSFDSRTLWRIASWGVGATAAVVVAVMANQSSLGFKREQISVADMARQTQQIQMFARETQNEARRLAAAIETLNGDRDRLYSRVTGLEQGLDSVTGAVARQGSARSEPQAAPHPPSPAVSAVTTAPASDKPVNVATEPPAREAAKADAAKADGAKEAVKEAVKTETAKPETTKPETAKTEPAKTDTARAEPVKPSPFTTLAAAQLMMAPPDPAAGKLVELGKAQGHVIVSPIPDVIAAAPSANDTEADDDGTPKASLQRTEFGVDLGTANSVNGLRMLWLGLLKSRSNAPLAPLRPIIVVRESNKGLGMQLHLVAGPLNDAGAAAKICAVLTENKRPCETTIFDGQRLSLKADEPAPAAAKPATRRRGVAKRAAVVEEVAKKPEAPPATTQATLSTILNRKGTQ